VPRPRPPRTKPPTVPRARAGTIERAAPPPPRAGRSPLAVIAAGVSVLLIIGVVLAWWLARPAVNPDAAKTVSAAASPQPPAQQPSTSQQSTFEQSTSQEPASRQPASSAVEAPAAAPAAASPPDPADLLRAAFERRTPSIVVRPRAMQSRLVIDRDQMRLSVVSLQGGYLYALMAGTEGDLVVLLPNRGQRAVRIDPGLEFRLPTFDAGGPPGVDRLLFVVSPRPLTLEATQRPGEQLAKFNLREIAAARQSASEPGCSGLITPCDATYGAALLEVEEVRR
jgi:Domain of unknown function (DUF4384)